MKEKIFANLKNKILVTSDHHFKNSEQEIEPFKKLLQSLDPKKYHLILLGDLFHFWINIPKTITKYQQNLLNILENFKKKGGQVSLVVGNRDIFFKNNNKFLPFDFIAYKSLILETAGKKILFEHGDLIDTKNKKYLLWRTFIRSSIIKYFLLLLPSSLIKKIASYLEKTLKKSTLKKNNTLPQTEWENFIKKNSNIDLCVVGHFHPHKTIVTKKNNTKAIIIADWLETKTYVEINQKLQFFINQQD